MVPADVAESIAKSNENEIVQYKSLTGVDL